MWCAFAGLQHASMKPQGQGLYIAEVCCRQAGLVTMLGKLNGRVIGRPKTVQIKASTACKLQVLEKDPIRCTAGLTHAACACVLHLAIGMDQCIL